MGCGLIGGIPDPPFVSELGKGSRVCRRGELYSGGRTEGCGPWWGFDCILKPQAEKSEALAAGLCIGMLIGARGWCDRRKMESTRKNWAMKTSAKVGAKVVSLYAGWVRVFLTCRTGLELGVDLEVRRVLCSRDSWKSLSEVGGAWALSNQRGGRR